MLYKWNHSLPGLPISTQYNPLENHSGCCTNSVPFYFSKSVQKKKVGKIKNHTLFIIILLKGVSTLGLFLFGGYHE